MFCWYVNAGGNYYLSQLNLIIHYHILSEIVRQRELMSYRLMRREFQI